MATGSFTLKQVNQAIAQGAWSGYIAPRWVEYLCVAGGGGSAGDRSGGAGGGGLLTGIVTVAAGTSYTVTVGSGGSGGVGFNSGANGSSSVFGSITTTGGGASIYNGTPGSQPGNSGGSGGGASLRNFSAGGQGTVNQGNAGGANGVTNSTGYGGGGGGGGAGTVGLVSSDTVAGNGGAGIASAITGSVNVYAGGGGGGATVSPYYPRTAGIGGVGGGGNGSTANYSSGTAGASNTGGGAGGSADSGSGANGGSGIVVVRYPGNVQFYTGGAITYVNGYIVHIFYASGTLTPTTPAVVATDYEISRSLRFNSADSAYLNRTPASATNRRTFTISTWMKRSTLSTYQMIMSAAQSNGINEAFLYFVSNDTLNYYETDGTGAAVINMGGGTGVLLRDPSAWYHIVLSVDTTQATATNRVKIYVNNVDITYTSGTYPTQNYQTAFNMTYASFIGTRISATQYFGGHLTEFNFVDGQALTPSSFGATNANTGVWGPKAYTGTYGTNGFYLNFSDNSNATAATLGKDYSGNGNNWAPNSFSVTAGAGNDSLVDTPTPYGFDTGVGGTVRGNYATWNALGSNKPNLTNGNLDADGQDLKTAISTMGVSSGKWYWEILIRSGTDTPNMGVTSFANDNADPGVYLGAGRSYVSSGGGSGVYKNYTATSTAADSDFSNANTAGAIIGFALDCDAGTLAYYVNNVLGYTDSTVATGTVLFPMTCNFNSTTNAYRNTSVNFGQRPFAYTAPSGFKALCTQNLPTPTVGSSPTTLATKYFNPVLYTGNGSTNPITGVGFQPDWVWIKSRNDAYNHQVYDAVRGTNKRLFPSTTGEEFTDTDALASFDSDGFTSGAEAGMNASAITYVAWNWKANGAGVSNTAGSITSSVSANPTSGFSIVTYTGNATDNATIGHGLNIAPSLLIGKSRSGAGAWPVWINAGGFSAIDYIALNSTDAKGTANTLWGGSNSSVPTSTVFKIGNGGSINGSGTTYVVYCFASVPGYSAFGSYTGNGSADGPFVFTGFRPAYILVKYIGGGEGWWVFDNKRNTYNLANSILTPNLANAELTDNAIGFDMVSNGFKIRNVAGFSNGSGLTYLYAAFAESPFKYSLAR